MLIGTGKKQASRFAGEEFGEACNYGGLRL